MIPRDDSHPHDEVVFCCCWVVSIGLGTWAGLVSMGWGVEGWCGGGVVGSGGYAL